VEVFFIYLGGQALHDGPVHFGLDFRGDRVDETDVGDLLGGN
jgi:hypothetical protein